MLSPHGSFKMTIYRHPKLRILSKYAGFARDESGDNQPFRCEKYSGAGLFVFTTIPRLTLV